jgi:hypothetical protein
MKVKVNVAGVQCRETIGVLAQEQMAATCTTVVNSTGHLIKMSPQMIVIVKVRLLTQKHVKEKRLRGSEHMNDVIWGESGQFCNNTETLCNYPQMDHLRPKTSSGSTDLCTCRTAWKSGSVHGR